MIKDLAAADTPDVVAAYKELGAPKSLQFPRCGAAASTFVDQLARSLVRPVPISSVCRKIASCNFRVTP